MNFNLSHIKTAKSRNGFSMSAKFYIDGIAVADFRDAGDGGEPSFYVYENGKADFKKFENELEKQPPFFMENYGMELKVDKGLFIDLLHAAIINKQPLKFLL